MNTMGNGTKKLVAERTGPVMLSNSIVLIYQASSYILTKYASSNCYFT